ncbi:MAG: hypothetical protein ACRDNS_14630, partial [Trebonia sp.]
MRLRHIALGCALTGGLGMLALPAVPAFAATAAQVGGVGLVGNPGHVTGKPVIGRLAEPVAHKATGPRISVSSPVTDARYDAKVTLTVTLKGAGASREVSLYATPSGGVRDLVATGVVDAKGKWYVRY